MKLNLRHKAGLFLTLVAVGCGLFLECSAKQAAGIALLGIAFAWLIGTLTPRTFAVTSAILISTLGLYVAGAPVWSDWNSVRNSAAQYDSAIADLQTAVKGSTVDYDAFAKQVAAARSAAAKGEIDLSAGLVPARAVKIPDFVQSWERLEKDAAASNWTTVQQSFPASMSDAEIMKDFQTKLLLPRPTFALGSSLRAHAWQVVGGLALFISGLSILGWLFRRTRVETHSRYAVP